ncbi:MAG: hypothetical protein WBR26_20255, partial [Candidatus Acidiferrum sp.]
MGERADEIEQQINRSRGDLTENFRELEEKAKDAFDWRTYLEDRPGTLLAVAFGGGALASALIPMRSKRDRHSADRDRAAVRDSAHRAPEKSTRVVDKKAKQSSETFGALKGALISVAA